MNSVLEVEKALRQLPLEDQWEVARWLLDDLQKNTASHATAKTSDETTQPAPPLPDYAARRRQIFDNKVLPNMVLVSRSEERW